MALLEGLLGSSLVQSLTAALTPPISISSAAAVDSLGELYLNPLYLLPIAGVLACCFLVYAFGFTSSSSVPPTLHLLVDENDQKRAAARKERKPQRQSKANGHANGHVPAKSPEKKVKQQPAKAKSEEPKAKPQVEQEKKQQQQKAKRQAVVEVADEDIDAGEWVQVTRKEKKERKVKDEKQVEKKGDSESPKKNKKAAKSAVSSSDVKVGGDAPTAAAAQPVTKPEEPRQENAATVTVEAKSEPRPQREKKQQKKPAASEAAVEAVKEEIVAEEPEQYANAPSKQLSKKTLKSVQQVKNRRISESEKQQQSPPLTPVAQVAPEEAAPVVTKPADKITAEIVASYDAGDGDKPAVAKSKNKKKKKPAAAAAPVNETPAPVAASQAAAKSTKENKKPTPAAPAPAPVEKQASPEPASNNNIPVGKSNEVSEVTDESSEGEFKVVKKRKARRE